MAGPTTDIAAGELAFVTERFEVAGGRLEVAGHWRGVRARRFVRPVLWLHLGDGRRRLVAVLEHKPWAAEDGEPWIAAFPWAGERLEADRAELEVGRDVLVELPVPGAPRRKPRATPARRPGELAKVREQLTAAQAEARDARAEADAARGALARARKDAERARADGERLVNDEWKQRQRALEAAEEAAEARALAERQLNAARASHADLERRLAASEPESEPAAEPPAGETLHDQLAAARTALSSVQPDRERLEAELASARTDAARLESELAAARTALSSARSDRERLESEVSSAAAGAELESARFDRDRLASELAATRSDLASLRSDRDRLAAELADRVDPPPPPRPARVGAASRLAAPREGTELLVVRLVALGFVALLLTAVVLLLAGIL